MVGSVIRLTNSALAITILLHRLELLEQSTSIEISLENQNPTSCPILLIRFDFAQRPEIDVLSTSFSTARFAQRKPYGAGLNIGGSRHTLTIATFHLLKQAICKARNSLSHYWRNN
jgi:hypothetical protein